jgi:hypothetical protein
MATNPNAPRPGVMPVSGWYVEDQKETVDLGPDGKPTQGMRVYFVTGLGVHSSLFIPKARYSLANVQAAVGVAAAEIDAVHKLTG